MTCDVFRFSYTFANEFPIGFKVVIHRRSPVNEKTVTAGCVCQFQPSFSLGLDIRYFPKKLGIYYLVLQHWRRLDARSMFARPGQHIAVDPYHQWSHFEISTPDAISHDSAGLAA